MKKNIFLILFACLICSSCGNSDVYLEDTEPTSVVFDTEELETDAESYISEEYSIMEESSGLEEKTAIEETAKMEETTSAELTEEEYKSICREIYYDDIFSDELTLGEKVKIHVFIAEKYRYSFSDIMGIIVEDITKQYNLLKECIGACAMHEETKDDTIPSYFGKQFYLMFSEDSEFTIDNYKTGQRFVVYGEVIQTYNGPFVLPKYIEEEE